MVQRQDNHDGDADAAPDHLHGIAKVDENEGILQGEQGHKVHPPQMQVEGKSQEPILGPGVICLGLILRFDEGSERCHNAKGEGDGGHHHLRVVCQGVQHLHERRQSVVVFNAILHLRPGTEDGSHLEDGEDALRREDYGPDCSDNIRRGGNDGGEACRLDGVGWQTEHPAKADAHVEEGGKEAVSDVQ